MPCPPDWAASTNRPSTTWAGEPVATTGLATENRPAATEAAAQQRAKRVRGRGRDDLRVRGPVLPGSGSTGFRRVIRSPGTRSGSQGNTRVDDGCTGGPCTPGRRQLGSGSQLGRFGPYGSWPAGERAGVQLSQQGGNMSKWSKENIVKVVVGLTVVAAAGVGRGALDRGLVRGHLRGLRHRTRVAGRYRVGRMETRVEKDEEGWGGDGSAGRCRGTADRYPWRTGGLRRWWVCERGVRPRLALPRDVSALQRQPI